MKKIKYKVTGPFGCLEEDTVIDAWLLIKDGNRGLIYHPRDKRGCGSFEIGIQNSERVWISITPDQGDTYVNLNRKNEFSKMLDKALGL